MFVPLLSGSDHLPITTPQTQPPQGWLTRLEPRLVLRNEIADFFDVYLSKLLTDHPIKLAKKGVLPFLFKIFSNLQCKK